MDRRTAVYLPLTAEVVAAHLVGDVFMGLYPLLTDNTCQFLAADFDGSTAMLDALAYCKSARAGGVPAALEISQSRSDATKVHPPLPMTVQAELAAGLSIDTSQLPPAALATFKHAASLADPKFYELQRLRKSTWDTPRFLRGYDLTLDGRLVLPRGLRHAVGRIVEDAGSRMMVTDTRDAGREIEVVFTAELTTRQSAG